MSQEIFERELHRRADQVHGAPYSFDDVRGKALSIRRRRRTAVAGGVAAAVALVVLVPTLLGGGSGPKSQAPEPAPATPGHTAVLHDGTLTLPDGGTVALGIDNEDVTNFGVLTDGRIVVATSQPYGIQVFGPDGALREQYPALVNVLTMSPSDDAVAWIGGGGDADRGVRILASGAAEPAILPGIPAAGESPGAVNAVLGADRVLVDGGYGTDSVLTPEGPEPSGLDELVTVDDVSPDGRLWAVHHPDDADPQFGCSGLYDPGADQMVARSCDTALLRFSPDGQHLTGAIGDGGTWASVEVFGLDLRPVVSYEPTGQQTITDWAWADDEHLLVVVSELGEDPQWSLVRVPVDGSPTSVVDGPVPGPSPQLGSLIALSD